MRDSAELALWTGVSEEVAELLLGGQGKEALLRHLEENPLPDLAYLALIRHADKPKAKLEERRCAA